MQFLAPCGDTLLPSALAWGSHFSLCMYPTRVMSDAALGVAQSDALAASYSMHAASPLFSDDWPISARRIWLHDSAICRPHK